ncbi:cytochrome b/b6 domain-containing protein [Erythrobacter sp. Alg231-14]|uniref:cytochrome b/b6 domain-containing protein n=1 Tax=Erythrobacter sp. Alg231-14 TaxID=1922225 RepID=UPI000D55E2B4
MTRSKKRHSLLVRIWHWINAAALIVLFMSGLTISNGHRFLYWGNYGFDPADAWMTVMRFPNWMTIPQRYDLAEARDWHNTSAWIFAVGLLVMWIAIIISKHFWRDIATRPADWSPRAWVKALRDHLPGGGADRHSGYNAVQRIAYGVVLGVFLPMMVFTGLAISPGFEPAAPWMVDALGGRQSARSLHFIFAWALFGFFVLHVLMVLISNPLKQIAQMITGGTREDSKDG